MPRRLIGQTTATGHKRKRKVGLGTALFGAPISSDAITPEREALIALWASDPWEFLQGRDTDATPIILTQDESDKEHPYKPIPPDYVFIRVLLGELFGPVQPVLIDKCRQTMASITCCFGMYWDCVFGEARRWYLSKNKEDEAAEMLQDKVRSLHTRTPEWFQKRYPVTSEPANKAYFPATNSVITAVSQTAADGAFRGPTPSGIMVDEAARQETLPGMFQAATASVLSNGCKLWMPTTPEAGTPSAKFFQGLLTGKDARAIGRDDDEGDDPA